MSLLASGAPFYPHRADRYWSAAYVHGSCACGGMRARILLLGYLRVRIVSLRGPAGPESYWSAAFASGSCDYGNRSSHFGRKSGKKIKNYPDKFGRKSGGSRLLMGENRVDAAVYGCLRVSLVSVGC